MNCEVEFDSSVFLAHPGAGTRKTAHELRQFSARPKDSDSIPRTNMLAQKRHLLQFRAVQ